MDYYKILDIPENASEDDIKREYRKLAMKYHPDRNPENREAEERFKKIGEAYEVLGNKEKRKKYDEKRRKEKKDKNLSQEKRERGKRKSEKEFKRVFSADPENIKNMFEKAFNINDLNNLEEKEGKEHKENIEKIFEKFFKIKNK